MLLFKYTLDGLAEFKKKKAKRLLNRGHRKFDKKDYKGAIYDYKKGIDYLKWVDVRAKSYKGDKGFIKTINILQALWGGLSRAYREIGDEVLADECLETLNYYMDLEQTCNKIYLEKEERLKVRNREILPVILFYAGFECMIFIAGFFLTQLVTKLFVFVSLIITPFLSALIYVIFNFHFRKTYSFHYKFENLRTELSRIPDKKKLSIEDMMYLVENYNFLLLILLFISVGFYLILFVDGGSIIYGNTLTAFIIMPIIGLFLLFLHGIIFWFTDWYEKKN